MNLDLAGGMPSGHNPAPVAVKKKRNLSSIVIVILIIGVIGAFGVFLFQKLSLQKDIKRLNTSIENTEREIQQLQGLSDTQGKQSRETVLKKALLFRTEWSRVMSAILKYESTQIQFLNFSSDENQQISIDGEAASITQVTNLMKQLEANEEIKNPFISTISGADKTSQKVKFRLSFELVLPSTNE